MQTLTYSALAAFRGCPKAYELRYLRQLVPAEEKTALHFGSVIHTLLEKHYLRMATGKEPLPAEEAAEIIDSSFPDRMANEKAAAHWHLAHAVFPAYLAQYPSEDFEIVDVERTFQLPLINPKTGRASRLFDLQGKVDGLIRFKGRLYLLEHKTTSALTGDYIERLPMDTQINLYAMLLEQELGEEIAGVIYNIIVKKRLQQGKGETDAEYEARKAASKTGKIKRKVAESDNAYRARLIAAYAEQNLFHREEVLLDRSQYPKLAREIWIDAKRVRNLQLQGFFPRNTGHCFSPFPCSYWEACRTNEARHIMDNRFKQRKAHCELAETPAF